MPNLLQLYFVYPMSAIKFRESGLFVLQSYNGTEEACLQSVSMHRSSITLVEVLHAARTEPREVYHDINYCRSVYVMAAQLPPSTAQVRPCRDATAMILHITNV